MPNSSQVSSLAANMARTGRAMGRLAAEERSFRAAYDAFRAEDSAAFTQQLSRFELVAFCEDICRWFCIKECVIECIELCGPPRGEFNEEMIPRFAEVIARIVRDEELVDRLAYTIADRDAQGYRQLVTDLKIEEFCHLLCHWACGIRCAHRCQVICDPKLAREQHFTAAILLAGNAIAKLAEDKEQLRSVIAASVALDCEQLSSTVGGFNDCFWICGWICSWRCALVCLTLCREFPPGRDLSIEERRQFALAAGRLAGIENAYARLIDAVEERNTEAFARLVKEYKLEAYCLQLCAWICYEVCRLFCFCVCLPQETIAIWTKVGNYHIEPMPNDFNSDGTTKVGGLAFSTTIDLNGLLPDGSAPQAIEYQFTYQDRSGISPNPNPVTKITSAQIAPTTVIGQLEYWMWDAGISMWIVESSDYFVNNLGATVTIPQQFGPALVVGVNVQPDPDGWIAVPRENNLVQGGVGRFVPTGTLISLDTTKITNESFDLTVGVPPLPLVAGNVAPPNVLSSKPVYQINFSARVVTVHTPVNSISLSAIALSNTSYKYTRHPDWPGPLPPVTLPLILSVDILELISGGGCTRLDDTIHGLYTAYHPYLGSCELFLQGPGVSGMTTPPAGEYSFALQPDQGQSLGTGNGVQTTFTGTLTTPDLPTSLTVWSGAASGTDNGSGSINGTGISSGSINYASGAISVTFASAPPSGTDVLIRYDMNISSGPAGLPFDMSGLSPCAYILWLDATLNLTNGYVGLYGTFTDYLAFCTSQS